MKTLRIAFDDGGSATLMTKTGYCHTYDDMGQLASDAMQILGGVDPMTEGWDGCDSGLFVAANERGYRQYTDGGIFDLSATDHWRNVAEFAGALNPETVIEEIAAQMGAAQAESDIGESQRTGRDVTRLIRFGFDMLPGDGDYIEARIGRALNAREESIFLDAYVYAYNAELSND